MAVIKIVPMPGAVGDKGDEGAPGPVGPQGERGLQGVPGTNALWSYQGAYNPAAAYAVGDVVVYQGQLYYTKSVTTAGTLPTNTAKFDLIASKGADGQPGTNGADGAPGAGFGIFYLGNYNPSSGYVPDIAVVRGSDGQLYLAKASGQLGDPVGNTAQWEVWIPKGADGTNGTNGTNGTDALWNYTGEYNGGASYAVGDIATYDGQLWYRVGANGGNVGDTPSPGFWNLLAAKGEPGTDVFAEDGTLYGPTNFGALKVLGLINSGDNDLGLYANDANIILQTADGKVDIVAPEVNIVSNVVPSSFNINTYNGAKISSARTSGYSDADKVVATLGDINSVDTLSNGLTINGYIDDPAVNPAGTMALSVQGGGYTALMDLVAQGGTFNGNLYVSAFLPNTTTIIETPTTINNELTVSEDATINGLTVGRGLGENDYNTAVGLGALESNTPGHAQGFANTAIGRDALGDNTTGAWNTAVGSRTLSSNTTGWNNVAVGNSALEFNTTGHDNTSVGGYSLPKNTTGIYNTALGGHTLVENTTGSFNTAVGMASLNNNTTGQANTAIGVDSLHDNTVGNYNVATGHGALSNNISGESNTANGYMALNNNTTGSSNTAVGHAVLYNNTTGGANTAVGLNSLLENTTGYNNTAVGHFSLNENIVGIGNTAVGSSTLQNNTANYNTALGDRSLFANTTGDSNTAIGAFSADANTTGTHNTSIGSQSLGQNQTGIRNTAVGADSLYNNITGDYNTAIGNAALSNSTSGVYNVAVGASALYNSNGSANTAVGIGAGATNVSGERNIFIGYEAGKNETGSDKLYIDVNDTATPLIHGDFATNTLTVNGSLKVSTGATGTFQTPDAKIVVVTNGIITSIESLT